MNLSEKENKALNFALVVTKRYTKDGKIYVPKLDTTINTLESYFEPVYQTIGWVNGKLNPDGKFIGYHVSEENASKICRAAIDQSEAVSFIRNKIAVNYLFGYEMPIELATLAYQILNGSIELAKPPPRKPTLEHRDALLVGIAKRISSELKVVYNGSEIDFDQNDNVRLVSSMIAASAFNGFDVQLNPKQAHKICKEKSKIANGLDSFDLGNGRLKGANLLRAFLIDGHLDSFDAKKFETERNKAIEWLKTPLKH